MNKCVYCRKEAVYFRNYSGEQLCKKCFIKSIEKRVKHTISKYNMFSSNDKIAVALSGGKDSVSLLHLLHKIEERFPQSELVAITIDEGVLGYRTESLKIAKKNCRLLGVKHYIDSFKRIYGITLDTIVKFGKKKLELSPCSYCGILRRKALNIAAKKMHITKMVTAHNIDDEIQSILLNFIRGDHSRISRIRPVLEKAPGFIQRIKPLSNVLEKEIALYAFFKKIEFQTRACPFLETSMRQDVRSFINKLETKHPGTKFSIYRCFEKIRSYMAASDEKIDSLYCETCGEPTTQKICRACQILEDLNLFTK
ncbi:MAG: TIGR00269 family protein [Candidatus Bathyarchaeota archaeon]|nr:MAG: TIGR00269 family protein [Candidatus Bathyarchaeota archaeon]